jgi:hypothetical protein
LTGSLLNAPVVIHYLSDKKLLFNDQPRFYPPFICLSSIDKKRFTSKVYVNATKLLIAPRVSYPEACFEMVSCFCLAFDTPLLAAG